MINSEPVIITGVIDLIIIIIFVSLSFRGFLRGFVKEIGGFIEIVALIFLLYYKTENFRKFISPILELSYIQALLVFFLIIHIAFLLAQSITESLLSHLRLQFFNRIFGLMLGFLEAFGIVAMMVYIIYSQQVFNPKHLLAGSKLISYLMPGIKFLFKIST